MSVVVEYTSLGVFVEKVHVELRELFGQTLYVEHIFLVKLMKMRWLL
jgi:hypothetical protein